MAEDKSSIELTIVALSDNTDRVVTCEADEDIFTKLAEESSEDFEFVEDDGEDRPPKLGHICFGKSTMMEGHIEFLKDTKYISNTIVRLSGEDTIPLLDKDEVLAFRCFLKAGLQSLLHKMVVEVLKKFDIYLHQLTPNTIMRLGSSSGL